MKEFTFDTSDFDAKFSQIIKHAVPEKVEEGLGQAMLQLMNDCVMEVPTVPIREGWLRGSGSVFVQNKLIGISTFGKQKFANDAHSEFIGAHEYIGIVGFNTPYAARLHEGISFKFTEPSSGAKYLESKLMRNRERYLKIIADAIRKGAQ